MGLAPASVRVLGRWKETEPPQIKALLPDRSAPWPQDPEKLLAALGADRAHLRSIAPAADGKGLVALVVDTKGRRSQVVRLQRNGRRPALRPISPQPAENDDTLGTDCRGLAVDREGNLWVATNAWGASTLSGSTRTVALRGERRWRQGGFEEVLRPMAGFSGTSACWPPRWI